mmetsp:Transcript_37590/g.59453  ORF Transcript_37590/g.59453 Transcript_37590/m.59453 type:complete len:215 (-) Transcript_37590:119-763(-)|eukprot:CAMPEP_0169131580 /NCGR_PEP_ID=MMETSP1015-20121227/38323_1 /TAXON_ID=342587 /ORGANISM="Karlodinium micrum, Strain CCMP2283" /LENGTH=214 /DNA_ID=CAMNT_0009195851 /DNA_START=86 /DNA_END=730 /DNA_ORIENTATION=+
MATTLKVKFGDEVKHVRLDSKPGMTVADILSSIYESFHFGDCSATFLDDMNNIQTLNECSAPFALEVLLRGQPLQLLITNIPAREGEQGKCQVITCYLISEDVTSESSFKTMFMPGMWKGSKGKGKGAKGKGWYESPWWNSFQNKGSGKGGDLWSGGCGMSDAYAQDASTFEAELEWKTAVLRQMTSNCCDAFLRNVLLANECNVQSALDSLVG